MGEQKNFYRLPVFRRLSGVHVNIRRKGDLLDPIKDLARIKDRLLLIEPSAESAFALNPLDVSRSSVVQAVNLIEYIMASLLDAKFTALQSTLFETSFPRSLRR